MNAFVEAFRALAAFDPTALGALLLAGMFVLMLAAISDPGVKR